MRVSSGGPIQPQPQIQKAQAAPPKSEATPTQNKKATPEAAKDENKTQSFDDTPMGDVSSLGFDGESVEAAEASEEIAELFDAEELEENEEIDQAEDIEERDELEELEEEPEIEELQEKEIDETEEEEGELGSYDADQESEGSESERKINNQALLDLIPEIRNIPRFQITETWSIFAGK